MISTKTDDQPRGVRLEYYVKKLQGPVNEKTDRSVIVEFNNDKKLVRVAVRNLPELFKRLTGVSATQTYWDDTNNGIEVEEREPSGVPVKRPLTLGRRVGRSEEIVEPRPLPCPSMPSPAASKATTSASRVISSTPDTP